MKRIFLLPLILAWVFLIPVTAYADGTEIVTAVNEYGYESTVVTDENGNTIVFEYVDDDGDGTLHDEVDIDAAEEAAPAQDTGLNTKAAQNGSGISAGGSVNYGGDAAISVAANGNNISGSVSSTTTVAEGETDGKQSSQTLQTAAPLVEQVKSALPESVQQALATETDEQGNPVVSSQLVTLLLIIILVLLLIIVAGIVLVIVLVVSRRKKADKPGKRAGKHTAGMASAGDEEKEKTEEKQPEE